MEVRDQDGADLSGSMPAAFMLSGDWWQSAAIGHARARVDHDEFVPDLQDDDGQWNWHVFRGHAGVG
jgi:hypothetical protein